MRRDKTRIAARVVATMLLCLSAPLFLAGCWDAVGLEEVTYPLLLGIDQADGEEDLLVTAMYFRYYAEENPPPQMAEAQDAVFGMALKKLAVSSENRWLAGMVQCVLVGEEAAKNGLEPLADLMLRDPQLPLSFQMAVHAGRAKTLMAEGIRDADSLWELRSTLAEHGKYENVPSCTFFDFWRDVVTPGCNPIMPVICEENNMVVVTGAAVFKKDRMVVMLDSQDAAVLALLRNQRSQILLPLVFDWQGQTIRATMRVDLRRCVLPKLQDGTLHMTLGLEAKAQLIELGGMPKQTPQEQLRQPLCEAVTNELTLRGERFLKTMQEEWRVDCVDTLRFAGARYPELVSRLDDPQTLADTTYALTVKAELLFQDETR